MLHNLIFLGGLSMPELYQIEQEESTQKGKFLTFTLGEELFGVDISYVTEINNLLTVVPLPGTPDYFKGVVSLRGRIIPVIDMRLKLRKQPADYDDRTCIVIVNPGKVPTGLIVDKVADVVGIADENIELPSRFASSGSSRYLQGIGKTEDKLVLILNCGELLMEDDCLLCGNH